VVTLQDFAADAGEPIELLADEDRPGGWLLLIDRIRQSYVDLDDPTYLDFEYVQAFAEVLDALPAGPLNVTHVGGGACTLARYLAATRSGSSQIVLEPDSRVTAVVRARLPFPRGARIRVRPVGGREGISALAEASADVVVIDAFAGGRVPAELATAEFLGEVARVLRPSEDSPGSAGVAAGGGVLLINAADGGDLGYTRRLLAGVRAVFPEALLRADPAVLKGRRFGNVVIAAARSGLPVAAVERAAARAMFPQRVVAAAELARFIGRARPLTDAEGVRSPVPPDELWRVQ